MSEPNLTPMMQQYKENKARFPDAILLFRMGDFYEMFYDDAGKASKILDIALTTRDKNKETSVPMCGFPHHAASNYISKLLAAGERVAVCDQIEDPKLAKGIVRREITKVLTPGLAEESGITNSEENHFICAMAFKSPAVAIASFDLSTGDFITTETRDFHVASRELTRLNPKEIILSEKISDESDFVKSVIENFYVHRIDDWMSDPKACSDALLDQYGVQNLDGFGLHRDSMSLIAAGMIVNYVRQTRPETPCHLKHPRIYSLGNYMVLDGSTLRNLEIFKNLKDGTDSGTLIKLLDKTSTSMGARLLRNWVSYPLLNVDEIRERSETVEFFAQAPILRSNLREYLKNVADLERIAAKISLRTANPRDLVHLRTSSESLPNVRKLLGEADTIMATRLRDMDDLSYVGHAVATMLVDSPPINLKDGDVIRSGYNEELDELRHISLNGKEWIAGIEGRERESTGIPNLKIGYNRVFGYYIEITRSHEKKIPINYVRKQTLVNAERYITEELKEYELKVLNAQDRILQLELEIFNRLRDKLIEVIPRIQKTAASLAALDCLLTLAEIGASRNYCRAEVNKSGEITISDGRHPVVESFDATESYVPNDVFLNNDTDQILIITGPNMAGKSTFMRQVALIVILAQIGSLVPAASASVGVADRIFTRIGAADYVAFGQSTFMVEMNETAEILNNATPAGLVLLDEIGRGTSTFDGLSIAWAVTEYLHDKPGGGPRAMFATHYHELVDISLVKERVRNYNIAVREWDDQIVFLRKIVTGGASRSYGIQVARLAGIPAPVITRAKEILANLEKEEMDPTGRPKISKRKNDRRKERDRAFQPDMFASVRDDLLKELQETDINELTPVKALNLLDAWKRKFG